MRPEQLLRGIRRGGGVLLLGASYLPIHRLLTAERAGPAGVATVSIADADLALVQTGTVVALLAGLVLATVIPSRYMRGSLANLAARIRAPSRRVWGGAVFTLALVLSLATARAVHQGLPRLLDEMVQLLHARVLASGALALPLPEPVAAFLVQNSVLTSAGWTSIYPPGHTVLLAAGFLVGAAWAVGPILLASTVLFTYLALDRLYPTETATVRIASLAVAASPFLLLLGSGYLSHGSAAAAAAVAFWAALRAWHGRSAWALLAGASFGLMVTSRPWMGLVLGGSLVAGTLACAWWRDGRSVGWLGWRMALAALGSLPFALAMFAYGTSVFGAPMRLGYDVAFGPAHGLGFHPDPWGNLYGLREALAYTAADLSTLGLHLFETPVSAVGIVGAFFLLSPGLSFQTRLLSVWALAPVAANALYWHHGQHMGPRMLLEAGPAWSALTVIAAAGLIRGGTDPGLPTGAPVAPRSLLSATAFWTLAAALVTGLALLAPSRIGGESWSADGLARSTVPAFEAGGDTPTIVFVHGTWANRVASRLAAAGMRRDSVETAVRQNDLCRVQQYAEARARGVQPLPVLDLEPRPGTPVGLTALEMPWGVRVRLEGEDMPPECLRELRSDRRGVVELAPLLWQLPFPGTGGHVLLARDLGPEENRTLIEAHAGARVLLLGTPEPDARPELFPYGDAILELWGNPP